MYQSFALAFRQFIFLLLCVLPLSSQAASTKEAPLDLSIIAQSDALRPYMTQQQQVDYIEAAQLIKQAESDIRSGENLQTQRPSTLNPDKDLKPIHERGEQLVKEGQAKVRSAQQQMIELLTAVQDQQINNQAVAAKKYNFKVIEQTYPIAIKQAAIQTLENCRNASYTNIFYDGLRIITAQQSSKAAPKVHNATYDTFIQADGTHFSLKVPLSLKLVKNDTTADYAFQYDNASVFEGEKVALVAIEVIAPGSGSEALLSVRALDLDTQRLISSVLFYIPDASEVLTPESENTVSTDQVESADDDTQIATTAPPRTIPVSVTVNDPNQLIEKLSGLASPYSFDTIAEADTTAQSILVAGLLKDTLLKNSALILAEGNFIRRSYLPTEAAPEPLPSAATATLAITQNEDNYTMIAKAHESDRELEVGTVTLNLPE